MEEPNSYEQDMQNAALRMQYSGVSNQEMMNEMAMEERERGMIYEQLNLEEEVRRIEHLLRGHIQREEDGRLFWEESKDPAMQIFTEYGIQLILNTISFYINKNTLLSNYDSNTILRKMKVFSSALNKTIFMEYKKIFKSPSEKECQDVLNERLEKKTQLQMYSLELKGIKGDKIKIKAALVKEMEERVGISRELQFIKESLMKDKLTRYLLLITAVQDAVHSTYNRAYLGQERKTLREHVHVSETRGGMEGKKSGGGMFGWLKG